MLAAEKSRILNWRVIAAVPLAGLAIHIVATLFAMNDTASSPYTRLAKGLPVNKISILPPVAPGRQPLPFITNDARYAMCSFDTASGPVSVNVQLPDHGWSVTIFHADGSSAYHAAASRGRTTDIALTIVPADDKFLGLTPEAKGIINPGAAPLTVSVRRGLIVVRAPDRGLAYAAEAEAGLARAKCAPKTY